MKQFCFILLFSCFAMPGMAHFPIFLHDAPFAQLGESIHLFFADGHPYEREWEDAPQPEKIFALLPSGKREDLTEQMVEKSVEIEDEEIVTWAVDYSPKQKGDTIFALNTQPYFGRGNQAYQEYSKVISHVDIQKGWDQSTNQPLEIVPYTRPYGLEEGFLFTGQLVQEGQPVPNIEIEIEQYLEEPPQELPPEPLITYVVKTDANGMFSFTLPRPGWWMLAGYVEDIGDIKNDNETYTLNGTAQIWVHVEEKP